jgi:hypothetical protein
MNNTYIVTTFVVRDKEHVPIKRLAKLSGG